MKEAELVAVVGVLVPLLFQWLKRMKWLDATDATVKQTVVAALAFLGVWSASGWVLTLPVLAQAAVAAIVAWGTHKGLLKQPAEPCL